VSVKLETDYEYRTGIGTDIHRLVPDRKLMLGGVEIPFSLGLLGHSDGDVVLHAVIDALLGAACMGDIGTLFPDTNPALKDADSNEMLRVVHRQLDQQRWEVVNVDLIVHAEVPRLEPFKTQMKRAIADIIDVNFNLVNVKAKTNEGLGDIGQGRAIAATAGVMLRRRLKRTL
jgi:2-C-methyl-D-erythritol 2,4-cyclodiphosphate synthase